MIRMSGGDGIWLDLGFNRDGDNMIAEYVPCDLTGRCLALHKKKEGYYCFHLRGNGKTVRFHRQLYKDVVLQGEIADTYEVHHRNFKKNDNRVCNLELMTKKRHCQLTAAFGRRR